MKAFLGICMILLSALMVLPVCAVAQDITPGAVRMIQAVDRLDVEHRWLAGQHVNWRTGLPDGRPERGTGKHTHCSAFVAAAADRLGLYILRPPEHSQVLLANAQYDWLLGQGAGSGWLRLNDASDAQAYANRGWFVVAAYKNGNSKKPGHIAMIRPCHKSADLIYQEGPQITQAGAVNYRSTSLKNGFAEHPSAFADNRILFFAHELAPD
jgi:hypothetical protein